ncbi:hypothetical protein HY478_04090 [Candidatus Uhrbacteria bacterium]|nr:hypothetical protein [Candidatus Uhrbacteria bacterium]
MNTTRFEPDSAHKADRRDQKQKKRMRMHGKQTREIPRLWRRRAAR